MKFTRKQLIFNSFLILFFFPCFLKLPGALASRHAELFPTLPEEDREAQIKKIKSQFEERWSRFTKDNSSFALWKPTQSQEKILAEYECLDKKRRNAWYVDPSAVTLTSRPDFKIAQDLLAGGLYRNLNTLAFDYNLTDSSYNSSTIPLDGFTFLALEGPKPEHETRFFNLLVNHHVTQLVRLTPEREGKTEMCANYWNNRTQRTSDTQGNTNLQLKVPQSTQNTGLPYTIPYYVLENWLDLGAGNPQELLDLVLKVRNSTTPGGLIACHCSSGVSRTGTFIAAFLLLNEIDKKIGNIKSVADLDISVERTVAKLSLLRPHAIGKPLQYLTLHRLVDLYVKRVFGKI